MKTIVLVLVLLLCVNVVNALPAIVIPERLVTQDFDNLSISVPDSWYVWKHEDYDSLSEAMAAVREMIDQVNPGGGMPEMTDTLRFLCVGPELIDDIPQTCQIYTISLEEALANVGATLDQVSPVDVLCSMDILPTHVTEIDSGSLAIAHLTPPEDAQVPLTLILTVFFLPEADVLAFMVTGHHSKIEGRRLDHIRQMAVSLRPQGEELQDGIWENLEEYDGNCQQPQRQQ